LSALANLAVTLGATAADEANIEKSARAALGRLAELRAMWLLVYDNVSSPDEVADLLPSAGARVLITSRFSDWREIADEVPLDVLPPDEAIAFLQSRTGRSDALGGRALAETLGYLPLALDHAAAYCRRTQVRFDDYAAKASSLIASVPRGSSYPRSVAATFDLAISQAVAQRAAAEGLMAFLAQCAPERIPMLLIEGAIDDEGERLQALASLVEVSLVKHDPFDDGTEAVAVHRLVQAVARARSEAKGLAQGAAAHLIVRLGAVYPGDGHEDPGSWPLCAKLTPHLLALQGLDEPSKAADWPNLLVCAGNYFHGRAAYPQATLLLREALAIREKACGPEHPDTATSLNNLAGLLLDQGDLVGARPLYQRALTIREKVCGPEHPDTAMSLNNLALVLKEQGDLVGARPLYQRALAVAERVLGPDHPRTARSLNNLAILLNAHGDPVKARPLYERALAIAEKVLGPEHPDTARSLDNLANLLQDQGDLAGARPLHERALAICEKVFGPEHPRTARSLNFLALVLQEQGDLVGARPLYERALAICEKVGGPEHPDTAGSLNNLAGLLRDQGNLVGALPLHERALAIREKVLGPEHRITNRSRYHLSRLLLDTGNPIKALSLGDTAYAAHEKALGRDHKWTKDSARVTADALDALCRSDEAAALRERSGITSTKTPSD
jgi:tetratricopeptide (TPR) repeat protein